MLVERFLESLPQSFRDWGSPSVRPLTDRFDQVLRLIRGMTTVNVLQLLNLAVDCLEKDEIYCEIGTFQGATLIGALREQPAHIAFAVDNFSQFDADGANYQALLKNLDVFQVRPQVRFFNQDFEEFFLGLRSKNVGIGVYLYDGAHDYRSQLLGLLHAVPFLADRALLVIDDSNCASVKQAAWDFMAVRPECRLLLDLPTPGNGHPTFWNGLYVLAWDRSTHNGYDGNLFQRGRQTDFLHSLSTLQLVDLKMESGGVRMIPTK